MGANSIALLKSACTGVGAKENKVAVTARTRALAIRLDIFRVTTGLPYFLRA